MDKDTYTVWYQTTNGSNSGRKTISLIMEDMATALTNAMTALGESGWTLYSMRDYNELVDQTGAAYIYQVTLTQTADVPS